MGLRPLNSVISWRGRLTCLFLVLLLLRDVINVAAYSRRLHRGLYRSAKSCINSPADVIYEDAISIEPIASEDDTESKIVEKKRRPIQNYSRRPIGFPLVKKTLQHYKMLYGNLLVPTSFIVPDKGWGWPEDSWNIKLGIVVQTIRRGSYADKREELVEMGFCFDVYQARYALVLSTLLDYKKLYGHVLVPQGFIVPNKGEGWPQEALGMRLGSVVHCIRTGQIYSTHRAELETIGFDYSSQLKCGWSSFKLALLRFKEINGHMMVNERFVVPSNSTEWAKELWGIKLGATVNNVRRCFNFKDKRAELLKMGFNYELSYARYHTLKTALMHYKKLYGDLLVPMRYEVPDQSDEWPAEFWGMKLGSPVNDIRRGSFKNRKEDLLSIGFVYVVRKRYEYEDVKVAVYKYRELYHGSVDIPTKYNIPHDDPWYPEETWGMCLGSYALRIKNGALWRGKADELFGASI